MTLLHDLAAASEDLGDLSGRLDKVARLARLLDRLEGREIALGTAWLAGELPQGAIGVGGATLREVLPVPPAAEPSLRLADVDAAFDRIQATSGVGSRERIRTGLADLLARATEVEQRFLVRLLVGEMRHGAQEGLMVEALARAAGVEADRVRRAVMLRGDAASVARAVLEEGAEALDAYGLELFRPVQPMLAQTAEDVAGALATQGGRAVVERKLDGARVQVHKRGGEVRVFTRRLNDETASLPDLVEAVRALPADELVLDGEALSLLPDGRPRAFQQTMRRFGRVKDVESVRGEIPLAPFFFDVLHHDGRPLLDRPLAERLAVLDAVVPEGQRVRRLVTEDAAAAERFTAATRAAGHEGVMVKATDAPYAAGRRGAAWLKVKPVYTADLAVLGVEWGSGRRKGWLSNLWLGARDEAAGTGPDGHPVFGMVGKTFKGMTDALLEWQTERLLELETERRGRAVVVRPDLVVEVAFDGVQRSSRYESGVALRFARVRGYREDKTPAETDTLQRLRTLRDGTLPG